MEKREFSITDAGRMLEQKGTLFTEIFRHGSMIVEYYKPSKVDLQQPHERDEIYVVTSGRGTFYNNGSHWEFAAGDMLFVAAGDQHWFEDFTDDFATWVFFYGPVGGEK